MGTWRMDANQCVRSISTHDGIGRRYLVHNQIQSPASCLLHAITKPQLTALFIMSRLIHVELSVWRDTLHMFPPVMYRVDDDADVNMGFRFPANDKPYFTGRGGLHFWVDLEDAVAFARGTSATRMYGCPRIQVLNVVPWQREWMSSAHSPTHTVPTMVLGVDGYNAPRRVRNEIVVPGTHDSVLSLDWVVCIGTGNQ